MNISQVIKELEKLPKDTLLYDSINLPSWHIGIDGKSVLAGSPCPIQTVSHLLHKLKLVQKRDLPSRDNSFRRHVYEDTELYSNIVIEDTTKRLVAEMITHATIKNWLNRSIDHMEVLVAIGGPSYLLQSDKVKVLVNKPYYHFLGINGKRLYLEELLSVHAFTWQEEDGNVQWFNQAYWSNTDCRGREHQLNLNNNMGGFSRVFNDNYVQP